MFPVISLILRLLPCPDFVVFSVFELGGKWVQLPSFLLAVGFNPGRTSESKHHNDPNIGLCNFSSLFSNCSTDTFLEKMQRCRWGGELSEISFSFGASSDNPSLWHTSLTEVQLTFPHPWKVSLHGYPTFAPTQTISIIKYGSFCQSLLSYKGLVSL